MGTEPGAVAEVRAVLARLADERERTGAYARETWDALCRHLASLSPDDARRLGDAVRKTVSERNR